jgi:hypothetical protein
LTKDIHFVERGKKLPRIFSFVVNFAHPPKKSSENTLKDFAVPLTSTTRYLGFRLYPSGRAPF